MLTFCVVWPGLDKATEAPWPPQVASHVLTPSSDRVVPVAVQRVEGSVEHADALLGKDGGSCRLVYQKNGPKPVVVLDLGKQSTGRVRRLHGDGENGSSYRAFGLRLPSQRHFRDRRFHQGDKRTLPRTEG